MDKILIIGVNGQIGSKLFPELQNIYGTDNVIGCDLRSPSQPIGLFTELDATNLSALTSVVQKFKVTQIYHLAAILSAKGETDPVWAWNINMQTLLNVLEVSRHLHIFKIFVPSSIAVFGKSARRLLTPQDNYLDPSTIYGISKVAAENLFNYYFLKYGLDIRSVRYPGIISLQTLTGGGTTDYAVDMFHAAVSQKTYACYLKEDTKLPMMYINDAIRGTIELMEAPKKTITIRSSYNLSGISFTPIELMHEIQHHLPLFHSNFIPDYRQSIADSWPQSIDDSLAYDDWRWRPLFDLKAITSDMLKHLYDLHKVS